jgi:hypothetical protein
MGIWISDTSAGCLLAFYTLQHDKLHEPLLSVPAEVCAKVLKEIANSQLRIVQELQPSTNASGREVLQYGRAVEVLLLSENAQSNTDSI